MATDLLPIAPPPIFSTLIVGLLLALAFQGLFTCLGIAAGVSVLRYAPAAEAEPKGKGSLPKWAIGVGTLLTVNTVLFGASFLSVRLNLVSSAVTGSVLGVVIWAGYWLLLLWLSTRAIGSLVGSVAGTIVGGVRGLIRTIRTNLQPKETVDPALANLQQQLIQIQKDLVAAQQERQALEHNLRASVEQQIAEIDDRARPSAETPPEIAELVAFLKATPAEDLTPEVVEERLARSGDSDSRPSALKRLRHTLLNRVDLSDVNVGALLGQLQQWAGSSSAGEFNPVQADAEDYLLHAEPWQLTRKNLNQEFREVLYDTEAEPQVIWQSLQPLDRAFFASALQQRQDLSDRRIDKIANYLEAVRQEVLEQVSQPNAPSELWQALERYVRDRDEKLNARTIPRRLKALAQEHPPDTAVPFDRTSVEQWLVDREDLSEKRIQKVREQLEEAWLSLMPSQPESTVHSAASLPRRWALRAKAATQDFQQTLTDYLHDADREDLTLENLQSTLKQWVKTAQTEMTKLTEDDRWKNAVFSADGLALLAVLAQRGDLDESQASRIVQQVKDTVGHVVKGIGVEGNDSGAESGQAPATPMLEKLRDSLRSLDLPNLNGEAVSQQISSTLQDLSQSAVATLQQTYDGISEGVQQQVVDLVDAAQSALMQQVEQVQQQATQQVEALKQQAQQRADATRKAVAIAAWWLFSIAFTSGAASAIGGAAAVSNFHWLTRWFEALFALLEFWD